MSLEKVQDSSNLLVPLLADNDNSIEIPINEKSVDNVEDNINESNNNTENNNSNNNSNNDNENENNNTAKEPNESSPSYLLYAGIPLVWMLARCIMGFGRRMNDNHHYCHDRHWNHGWGQDWGRGWGRGRGRGWVRDRDYGYGCHSCCHCSCNNHNHHYNDRSWFGRKNSSCNNYRNNYGSYQNPFWWGLQNYWGYGDDYGSCQECSGSGRKYRYW